MLKQEDIQKGHLEDEPEKTGSLLWSLWNRRRKKEEAASAPVDAPAEEAAPQETAVSGGQEARETPSADSPAAAEPAAEAAAQEQELPEEEPAPEEGEPVDAQVELTVSPDRMEATAVVKPPRNGGNDLTVEQLTGALRERGIKFGINERSFGLVVKLKMYDKVLTLASGLAPVDGLDGRVEDHFPREHRLHPTESADGSVDFKDLNLVTNISAGTVICDIIPPVPPKEGRTIYDEPVNGMPGKEAVPPKGRNTELSADGAQLLASCDGNLVFSEEKFAVEDVLRIQGNVNNEVGNLDFCGDILIFGDVYEGFTVQSKKSIEIKGNVEGATVCAGENITLAMGMNGMGKGLLQAGGDVHCRFLENATVNAGGSVFIESAMNATILAGDKIEVSGRRGALIGGSYTARNQVVAKAIGSDSHVATSISLGASPDMVRRRGELAGEITALTKECESMELDIAYLADREKSGRLTPAQKDMLGRKRVQQEESRKKMEASSEELAKIDETMSSLTSCRLTCSRVYPPTQISIGNDSMTVYKEQSNCMFFFEDGRIQQGSS